MRRLDSGVQAGVTGVAGFAGLLAVITGPNAIRSGAFSKPVEVLPHEQIIESCDLPLAWWARSHCGSVAPHVFERAFGQCKE